MAWDVCNAYHLARPGGWVLIDDVVPGAGTHNDGYVSAHAAEMLDYIASRAPIQPILLLKRRAAADYCFARSRKYVGCFVKPEGL